MVRIRPDSFSSDADASLFISTPFDPIFLFLPIFEEARMKVR